MEKFRLQNVEFYDTYNEDVTLKIYNFKLYHEGEQYGDLRVEINPIYPAVHPNLFKLTPAIIKRLESDIIACAWPIIVDHYGFDPTVVIISSAHRLPKLISKKVEKVQDNIGGTDKHMWFWRM